MSKKQPLNNAGEIIDRFGGIRPMAAKIDTPVTTVQGWKKRDVIPGTRRDQIMSAAADLQIEITDLVNGGSANENTNVGASTSKKAAKPKKKATRKSTTSSNKLPRPVEKKTAAPKTETVSTPKPETTDSEKKEPVLQDEIFAAIEANNRKTLARSAWIAVALILIAGLAAFFLLGSNLKDTTLQSNVDEVTLKTQKQEQELQALKAQVNDVNQRSSFVDNMMPEGIQAGLQEKMDALQTQARNIQNTVDQLSDRASEISSEISSSVLGPDAGPLSQRLEMLEEKMASLSTQGSFSEVIERIGSLEGSIAGQEQLKNSVDQLKTMVENIDQNSVAHSLDESLANAQNGQAGTALSETLEGVSGNDLKAAAMLIAFSQLRNSLNRNAPFENDLALMQRLVNEDDVELQSAITTLAPHANGGVLSVSGLSGEFKGLTGDILEASLKGEDVSFKEKAKARFNNLLSVEKDGEVIGGTQTQTTVSKAQKLLDEGNIQAAIAELQTLDGEAANAAQPFIQRAEVSLLAERVQEMLGETILSRITDQIPSADVLKNAVSEERRFSDIIPQIEGVSELNMDEVKKNLQEAIPDMGGAEVIKDDASGVKILPNQSGFKGFSAGE